MGFLIMFLKNSRENSAYHFRDLAKMLCTEGCDDSIMKNSMKMRKVIGFTINVVGYGIVAWVAFVVLTRIWVRFRAS